MEKILSLVLIILAFGAITALIIYSMKKLTGRTNAAQILQYGREREFFVYEMLQSDFPRGTVMRNLFFPVPTKEGIFDTEVDIVCVTRGGIAVLEIKGSKGYIECPPKGPWCQKYKRKVMQFESPYEQNEGHIKAIRNALEKHGIVKVPIRNFVVFPDINVRFSHSYPWLLRSDSLLEAIESMDDRLCMTRKDQRYIADILRRYRRRRHPTFRTKHRKQNKNQRRPQS